MARTNKYQEDYKKFTVVATQNDTVRIELDLLARTHWEAIDKAYTRLQSVVYDRANYKIKEPVKKNAEFFSKLSNTDYHMYLQELRLSSWCMRQEPHE